MPVNIQKYARELEEQIAKGKSTKEAHNVAVKKSTPKITKPKKSWVSRLKTNVQMLLKGSKYYTSKYAKKGKPIKTTRTKTIERGVRAGGLTEKEIARLRGKR